MLTPQGFRIENSDGKIVDQADWNDIQNFVPTYTRAGTVGSVCYCLNEPGRKHRRELLDTESSGRESSTYSKTSSTQRSLRHHSFGVTVRNDDLPEPLTEAHRRHQGRRHQPTPTRTCRAGSHASNRARTPAETRSTEAPRHHPHLTNRPTGQLRGVGNSPNFAESQPSVTFS